MPIAAWSAAPIRINGEQYDVIGVMPPDFDQIGDAAEAWIPAGFTPAQLAMFDEFYLDVYARHKPEFSLAQVNDEFVRVAQEPVRRSSRT